MRIIAGKYGGRRLNVPKDKAVRPTTDRVREALFSALATRLNFADTHVLDAFAGTGALGLEALSRGAQFVTFMDSAPTSLKLVKDNISALKADNAKALRGDATKPKPYKGPAHNLLFLDPPYGKGLVEPALIALGTQGWLADETLAVIETDRREDITLPQGWVEVDERRYGDTKILIAERSL